jgi:hypothetical protein
VKIRLGSGREVYANCGILGLPWEPDPRDPRETLFQGYDGGAYIADADMDDPGFTPAERREIADHMVRRWREWGGIE